MAKPEEDGQLYIRYLKKGDKDALKQLWLKYKEALTMFLYGLVHSMDDAEELMMDTFAILSSRTAHYSPRKDASFKTWLYAIGRNQARMFQRKHREVPSEMEEGTLELPASEDIAQRILTSERNTQLWKALQTLHADYAQVLYLSFFEDMNSEQIARIMKKTVKQVYNLQTRAKAALKEKLEGTGYSWEP